MFTTYSLVDPRDCTSFYVGQTINLFERFKQHLRCDGSNLARDTRIQELEGLQLLPMMWSLEQTETLDASLRSEQHWITHHWQLGDILTNAVLPCKKTIQKTQIEQVDPSVFVKKREFCLSQAD